MHVAVLLTELKEERVLVLEAWRKFEEDYDTDYVDKVSERMPKKVKKRRLVDEDAGVCPVCYLPACLPVFVL